MKVTDDEIIIDLIDGRRISAPIVWYPRLLHGSDIERNTYELIERGTENERQDSDADIGLLFEPEAARDLRRPLAISDLRDDLDSLLEREADLLNLQRVSAVFQKEVIRDLQIPNIPFIMSSNFTERRHCHENSNCNSKRSYPASDRIDQSIG